ncbi:DMT family transporter [Sedimentitalea todarodis]|uniref:DMT family transporter n=1 Tax=Sedimentitalea todarodis TaxID=1631240 RepID=A0ABU3VKX0_9RHOB|nr:DMT family transporter [Sedimentitalea todarodis]MDU9006329.1 DMT family transporter [Sedimentitalea todarodis]
MTRREQIILFLFLVLLGAGWGITQPLSKIAVSTGHGHFGLIFWQLVIGALLMGIVMILRRDRLPRSAATFRVFVIIALVGTIIPNSASYKAIAYIPAGVMSVLLSLVPLAAFPMALGLGLERFSLRRFGGLLLGLAGVALLVLPETSLPDPGMLKWVAVAMIASACYAFEGNYVARWGIAGMNPIQVMFGASLVGAMLCLPLALASGQFIDPLLPWDVAEWALVASSLVHVMTYTGYVWLVGRAGAVFAVQVSYLVTGFGVFWAMLLLGESYSPYFWAAAALMLAGVFVVQPRRQEPLAPDAAMKETVR